MSAESKPSGVYQAIQKVMATLAKEGISKDRRNQQQGYNFRGIDDVYNALSAALVEAQLVILPEFTARECVERTSAKGGALFYVTVTGKFRFVCSADGSECVIGPFYGEAMDSADKATNKAMSAAYKYMAMEVFCIPTEGDNDADSTTHEVKAKSAPPNGSARRVATDALDALEPHEKETILRKAQYVEELNAAKGIVDAVQALHDMNLDTEGKLAIWACFDSSLRSSIKREEERLRQLEKETA